jgi:hypothetical protein
LSYNAQTAVKYTALEEVIMAFDTQKFTVVEQPRNWGIVTGLLEKSLKTTVCTHPKHPHKIILWGKCERSLLEKIIGGRPFGYMVLMGIDNVHLPFRPLAN